ncbi:MAG: hypothetical protein IJV38_07980 [Prevotella sp.]|nr:hypothetical protein [Prevotella sp.]
MLQSEFYDRTHVSLSAEEYGKVENIYNRLQMDKDEFCQLWLKNRDNKIIAELMTYIMGNEKKLYDLEKRSEGFDKLLQKVQKENEERIQEFGRKIISNFEDDTRIYDVCEEEFGLDFICKVKLENNMDLDSHEREHLVKKL